MTDAEIVKMLENMYRWKDGTTGVEITNPVVRPERDCFDLTAEIRRAGEGLGSLHYRVMREDGYADLCHVALAQNWAGKGVFSRNLAEVGPRFAELGLGIERFRAQFQQASGAGFAAKNGWTNIGGEFWELPLPKEETRWLGASSCWRTERTVASIAP